MIIRSEQLAVLENAAARRFEDLTFDHVAVYFPDFLTLCEETQIRSAIRDAWRRANAVHNIESERGVLQYVDVSLMLGASFDSDPRVPWAAAYLRSPHSEPYRTQRLFDHAIAFIDATKRDFPTWGGERKVLLGAMHRLDADFSRGTLSGGGTAALKARLDAVFKVGLPARYEYLGEKCMSDVLDSGISGGRDHGLTTERGIAIYTTIVLLLGIGVIHDPLYPWVAAAMSADGDPSERAERLWLACNAQLRQWLV